MNSIQLNTLFVYSDNSPVMNSDPLGNVSISSVKTSVDLCINSPNPNSSVVFAQKGRDFTAGHVYLVLNPGKDQNLKKKYGTCAFGFAPRSQRTMVITIQQFLNPKVYARGRIMDESKNRFSVFVRFNITKTQFENVVKYKNKMQKSPPNYNLIKFNCATFALSVLEKAGIKHKFKPKFWNFGANLLFFLMLGVRKLYFKGYTPAQMAYDVLHGKIK